MKSQKRISLYTQWPVGTVCILGDSMLSNLDERRLGRDDKVKVRFHCGGNLEDMFDHIKAVLRRKHTNIIFHVGTNNTPNQDPRTIRLNRYIEVRLKTCSVSISSLVTRNDNT